MDTKMFTALKAVPLMNKRKKRDEIASQLKWFKCVLSPWHHKGKQGHGEGGSVKKKHRTREVKARKTKVGIRIAVNLHLDSHTFLNITSGLDL